MSLAFDTASNLEEEYARRFPGIFHSDARDPDSTPEETFDSRSDNKVAAHGMHSHNFIDIVLTATIVKVLISHIYNLLFISTNKTFVIHLYYSNM